MMNINFRLNAFNRCIGILYIEKDIRHRKLADALSISPSCLNGRMKKYLKIDPPLIKKQKDGKFVSYSLTEEGKDYYNENLYGSSASTVCQNGKEIILPEMKKALISYMLMSSDTIENPYVQILRKIDVCNISNLFSINEFFFLSTELGIIPEDLISVNSALEYTTPRNDSAEKERWAKEVWRKFQTLIYVEMEKEGEKSFLKLKS